MNTNKKQLPVGWIIFLVALIFISTQVANVVSQYQPIVTIKQGSHTTITTLENSVHDYDRDQYIRNCRYDMEWQKSVTPPPVIHPDGETKYLAQYYGNQIPDPRFVGIFDSIGDAQTKIQREAQDLNWTSVILDTSSTHLIIRYYGYHGDNPCVLPAYQITEIVEGQVYYP